MIMCRTFPAGHTSATRCVRSRKAIQIKTMDHAHASVRGAGRQDEAFLNAHSSSEIRSRAGRVPIADSSLIHDQSALGIPFANTAWGPDTLAFTAKRARLQRGLALRGRSGLQQMQKRCGDRRGLARLFGMQCTGFLGFIHDHDRVGGTRGEDRLDRHTWGGAPPATFDTADPKSGLAHSNIGLLPRRGDVLGQTARVCHPTGMNCDMMHTSAHHFCSPRSAV